MSATTTNRFDGAVYDQADADIGRNRQGERVVRLELTYSRGTAPTSTILVLTVDAAIALRNHIDGLLAAAGIDDGGDAGSDDGGDLVQPEDACPNCGERCVDKLVWFENADQVQCESCSHVYAPPRAADTAGQPRDEARGW